MAWTNAARAAALMTRRLHSKYKVVAGHRVTPISWFHGSRKAIHGSHLTIKDAPSLPKYRRVYATQKFKLAKSYAKSGYKAGILYKVTAPPLGRVDGNKIGELSPYKHLNREVMFKRPVRVHRLPRAHGRASRGKY